MTQTAKHLAKACQKIAQANHYMVGLDAAWTAGISYDDFSDARRILVDAEVSRPSRAAALALDVLAMACKAQHRTEF